MNLIESFYPIPPSGLVLIAASILPIRRKLNLRSSLAPHALLFRLDVVLSVCRS